MQVNTHQIPKRTKKKAYTQCWVGKIDQDDKEVFDLTGLSECHP